MCLRHGRVHHRQNAAKHFKGPNGSIRWAQNAIEQSATLDAIADLWLLAVTWSGARRRHLKLTSCHLVSVAHICLNASAELRLGVSSRLAATCLSGCTHRRDRPAAALIQSQPGDGQRGPFFRFRAYRHDRIGHANESEGGKLY